jgi:hypothetical protein
MIAAGHLQFALPLATSRPQTLARIVLLIIGLSVIVWLVQRSGPAVVWALLVGMRWRFLVVAVLYFTYLAIRALALWRIVPTSMRYLDILRIRLSGDAIEILTFTGPFFAEPTKGWLLTRSGLQTDEAFAAVATEYLIYNVVTACLSVTALVVLLALGALPPLARAIAFALLTVLAVFLGAFAYAAFSGVGVIVPIIRSSAAIIGRRRAEVAAQTFSRVERVLVDFLHRRHRAMAEVFAIHAASQVLLMVEVYVVLTAIVARTAWWYPAMIEGAAKFSGLMFAFIPAQVGAAEGVYAFLTSLLGLSTTAGLTLALVRRIRGVLVAAIGVGALTLLDSTTTSGVC